MFSRSHLVIKNTLKCFGNGNTLLVSSTLVKISNLHFVFEINIFCLRAELSSWSSQNDRVSHCMHFNCEGRRILLRYCIQDSLLCNKPTLVDFLDPGSKYN